MQYSIIHNIPVVHSLLFSVFTAVLVFYIHSYTLWNDLTITDLLLQSY